MRNALVWSSMLGHTNFIPTDDDLRKRLTITEDQFTERKSSTDEGGWIKTVVAFANSAPIGYPGILFIGVDNAGSIQPNLKIEDIMRKLEAAVANKTWPPVYLQPKTLSHNGLECIAVLVPGSELRPHFAGRSYVRVGTETKDASEKLFAELVASHLSKARELLKWKGKHIRLITMHFDPNRVYSESHSSAHNVLEDCNAHFVTIQAKSASSGPISRNAYPLHRIEIGMDVSVNVPILYIYTDR